MEFVHYEDITPNFNVENWKDKCPKPNAIVLLVLPAKIEIETFFGDIYPEAFKSEVYFVARINEGGTFTSYWAESGEVYEATKDVARAWADKAEFVATYGRKVLDLDVAMKVFHYLSSDYGLEAIV